MNITINPKSGLKYVAGKNAYDIIKMPESPFTLPKARSMTQARIDFEAIEDRAIEWYINYIKTVNP